MWDCLGKSLVFVLPGLWKDSTMSSLGSGPRGNRDASPPRRGTLDLVRELARLRATEPARFPAAYDELKVRQRGDDRVYVG